MGSVKWGLCTVVPSKAGVPLGETPPALQIRASWCLQAMQEPSTGLGGCRPISCLVAGKMRVVLAGFLGMPERVPPPFVLLGALQEGKSTRHPPWQHSSLSLVAAAAAAANRFVSD